MLYETKRFKNIQLDIKRQIFLNQLFVLLTMYTYKIHYNIRYNVTFFFFNNELLFF